MGRVVLITGGSRSGKSRFAQEYAENLSGPRCYIATCPVVDAEMDARIARHQQEREGRGWSTREEETELAAVIRDERDTPVLLIDCLTLWVNNLLYHEAHEAPLSENAISARVREILDAAHAHPGTIVFVTNEIGLGIIPDNPLSRRYRDLVGRCSQTLAAGADAVALVVCGCPLFVKGTA